MTSLGGGHDAPGVLAGTELQFVRALYWLAKMPDHGRVGIETGDDVVVESPAGDGISISEQDKSSLQQTGHPFTDRSEGLWKTLAIWASSDHLNRESKHDQLLLVTNRPVPSCLARRMSEASNDEEANGCVEELLDIAQELPTGLRRYATVVDSLEREDLVAITLRVHLCDGSELSLADQTAKVASLLHYPFALGDPTILVDALAGWLRRRCLDLWQKRLPAWIERESFDRQYHAVLSQMRRERTRERSAHLIPIDPADKDKLRTRTFVHQLILIAAKDPDVDHALTCYLQFNTERIRLTEKGDITEYDWDSFFSNLEERWRRLARTIEPEETEVSDEELGQLIFRKTVDSGFCAHLAGESTTAEYFTSGGYHRLADNTRVWWHPAYPTLSEEER